MSDVSAASAPVTTPKPLSHVGQAMAKELITVYSGGQTDGPVVCIGGWFLVPASQSERFFKNTSALLGRHELCDDYVKSLRSQAAWMFDHYTHHLRDQVQKIFDRLDSSPDGVLTITAGDVSELRRLMGIHTPAEK